MSLGGEAREREGEGEENSAWIEGFGEVGEGEKQSSLRFPPRVSPQTPWKWRGKWWEMKVEV